MSKDINCPYCEADLEICHDDGFGYAEDVLHEDQCPECHKYFTFDTTINFSYDAHKADCLNGEPHKFKPTTTFPKDFTMMECISCDKRRKPTDEEMSEILAI